MADFAKTSIFQKPFPTPFKDVFVRSDTTEAERQEFAEAAEVFNAKPKRGEGEDALREKVKNFIGVLFRVSICDAEGQPFDNTPEQLAEMITIPHLVRISEAVQEVTRAQGKHTK